LNTSTRLLSSTYFYHQNYFIKIKNKKKIYAQQMTAHQMPDNFVKFLTFLQNASWNSKILREILIIQLFPIVLKDCASALHIK
jgi:hypothetical protein